MECNHANRWQSAWWPSYRCIWRARALICTARMMRASRCASGRAHPDREPIRSPIMIMELTKWNVDALTMKASTHTSESGVCETRWRSVVGAQVSHPARWLGGRRRGGSTGLAGGSARCVNWPRGPVGRAGAYFKPGRALHRPLCETVGYARRAAANSWLLAYRRKEKWNAAQWCGRARRFYTPRGLQWSASQCRVSVASRTLELCCASPTPTAGLF